MRILGGKPLLMHSVEVAKLCGNIDEVVVSSDSDEILTLAKKFGVTCIKRPVELCADDVPNYMVCKHVADKFHSAGKSVEKIVLLQPTHPFRDKIGIENALEYLDSQPDADSLISVKRTQRLIGSVGQDKMLHSISSTLGLTAKCSEELYEVTGHIFIMRVKKTVECRSLLGEKKLCWNLPANWLDIDIDTLQDYEVAKSVMSCRLQSNIFSS